MFIKTNYIFLILILSSITMSSHAALYDTHNQAFASGTLKGIKSIAINIDPPTPHEYGQLSVYGVSSQSLQDIVSSQLVNAGFKVISLTNALEDPDAVVLDLRVRVVIPSYSYYSYNLKLSLKQKVPLPKDKNAFISVNTWSDTQIGALQQSDLRYLNDYTLHLVENFIQAYHSQN